MADDYSSFYRDLRQVSLQEIHEKLYRDLLFKIWCVKNHTVVRILNLRIKYRPALLEKKQNCVIIVYCFLFILKYVLRHCLKLCSYYLIFWDKSVFKVNKYFAFYRDVLELHLPWSGSFLVKKFYHFKDKDNLE